MVDRSDSVQPRILWTTTEQPLEAFVEVRPGRRRLQAEIHGRFDLTITLSGRYERHFPGLALVREAGDVTLSPDVGVARLAGSGPNDATGRVCLPT